MLFLVSTHAPLAGSDMISFIVRLSNILFQPTLPLRGATEKGLKQKTVAEFQPTLPLRGATTVIAAEEVR